MRKENIHIVLAHKIVEYFLSFVKRGGEKLLFDNIKAKCTEKGISVTSLEKAMSFGNGTINYWRDHEPGAYKLKRVADFLGVTVDALLQG